MTVSWIEVNSSRSTVTTLCKLVVSSVLVFNHILFSFLSPHWVCVWVCVSVHVCWGYIFLFEGGSLEPKQEGKLLFKWGADLLRLSVCNSTLHHDTLQFYMNSILMFYIHCWVYFRLTRSDMHVYDGRKCCLGNSLGCCVLQMMNSSLNWKNANMYLASSCFPKILGWWSWFLIPTKSSPPWMSPISSLSLAATFVVFPFWGSFQNQCWILLITLSFDPCSPNCTEHSRLRWCAHTVH